MSSNLAKAILELVKSKGGGVSFVEIQKLPGAEGIFGIDMIDRNVEIWRGLSAGAALALAELRADDLIYFCPCSPLIYAADGMALDLPVVRSIQAYVRGYRRPHWLPMTVELGPHPNQLKLFDGR